MPRTKLGEKYSAPPIDKLKACFLERKLVMDLDYKDFAEAANVSDWYIRKLMSQRHTDEWPTDVRKAVCKRCGLSVKTVVDVTNLE